MGWHNGIIKLDDEERGRGEKREVAAAEQKEIIETRGGNQKKTYLQMKQE